MRKWVTSIILAAFACNSVLPSQALAQSVVPVPAPGQMVGAGAAFDPAMMAGVKVDPKQPLHFDFYISQGQKALQGAAQKDEYAKLLKYFMAALTIPEKDLWVNLSPVEKDRIIPDALATTRMGTDLLAQDYLLKQLTASLIYPESDTGKAFWKKVYDCLLYTSPSPRD